ncbi:MAG: hypothetical protein HY293_13775 [Planctomycetes bacterium]|nr:hypothetical protein [Planctomycetota bacterium]
MDLSFPKYCLGCGAELQPLPAAAVAQVRECARQAKEDITKSTVILTCFGVLGFFTFLCSEGRRLLMILGVGAVFIGSLSWVAAAYRRANADRSLLSAFFLMIVCGGSLVVGLFLLLVLACA